MVVTLVTTMCVLEFEKTNIFTNYVGYFPKSQLPENIPIVTDSFLNPFLVPNPLAT